MARNCNICLVPALSVPEVDVVIEERRRNLHGHQDGSVERKHTIPPDHLRSKNKNRMVDKIIPRCEAMSQCNDEVHANETCEDQTCKCHRDANPQQARGHRWFINWLTFARDTEANIASMSELHCVRCIPQCKNCWDTDQTQQDCMDRAHDIPTTPILGVLVCLGACRPISAPLGVRHTCSIEDGQPEQANSYCHNAKHHEIVGIVTRDCCSQELIKCICFVQFASVCIDHSSFP